MISVSRNAKYVILFTIVGMNARRAGSHEPSRVEPRIEPGKLSDHVESDLRSDGWIIDPSDDFCDGFKVLTCHGDTSSSIR